MRQVHRHLCGALLAGGLCSTGAFAADLPAAMRVKAPVAAPAYSWTGLYVGLGLGSRSTQTDATVTGFLFNGFNQLAVFCGAAGGCIGGEPLNMTASRFSPYLGLNWQIAPQWVVGIEGDWGRAGQSTTLAGFVYPGSAAVSAYGVAADGFSVRTTWDASARARVGLLPNPSVLVYATGGVTWLRVESTSTCNTLNFGNCGASPPSGPPVITDARTRTGWTLGGGIEAMLWASWIARGEYRYADFGTISNTDVRIMIGAPAVTSYDLRVRTHTATFGLAYKFWGHPGAAPAGGGPAAPAVAPSWSGVYVGLGLGTRSTRTDATVTAYTIGGVNGIFPLCTTIAPFGGCVTGEPLNDTGFRLGPHAGVNWQVAPQWVVGIEGDWGWAGKTTTLAGMIYPFLSLMGPNGSNTFSVRTTWDASARGRIGYLATPAVLLYATGGAAWLHVESTSSCYVVGGLGPQSFCGPAGLSPAAVTDSTTKAGWTVGGGIEAMLWSSWIARAEYRYADFGTISNTDTRTNAVVGAQVASYDLRVRTHTATFGLAYKFDWSSPVVAKH